MAHLALNTVGQWEGELHRKLEARFNGNAEGLRTHALIAEFHTAIITAAAMKMDIGDLPNTATTIENMARGKRRKLPIPESSATFLTWKMQSTIEKLAAELDGRKRIEDHLRSQASSSSSPNITT